MSWASATSPISSTTGPRRPRRRRTRERRCRRSRWRRGWTGTRGASSWAAKNSSTSRIGIEEATNSVASAGSHSPSERATSGSDSSSPSVSSIARRRRRRRRATPRASRDPPAVSGARGLERGDRDRRRSLTLTTAAGSCHAPSGSSATCGDAGERRQPGAQRLGGGQVADPEHELGAHPARRTAGRAAAGRSGRSPPGRGARPTAGRRAAGSRRARRTAPRRRRGRGRARRVRRRHPARAAAQDRARRRGARGGASRLTHGRPPGRPPSSAGSGSDRTSGSRSGKLRCTGPGRPSSAVQYARQASARIQRRRAGAASWTPTSKNHLTASP